MLKVQDGTGEKASKLLVPLMQDGDKLSFVVSAKQLCELAKPSSTGASEGLMLSFTGRFTIDIDGQPLNIDMSTGRGGTGAWAVLKATKRLV